MLQIRWTVSGNKRLTTQGDWVNASEITTEEMMSFPQAAKDLGYDEANVEFRTVDDNNKEE